MVYDIPQVTAFSTERGVNAPFDVIMPRQIHSDKVGVIKNRNVSNEDFDGYDALITNVENLGIAVRTADCVPILLYDPTMRVVAAVHSGWRGTVLRIVEKTIDVMENEFNMDIHQTIAIIGPSICYDNFQVGEEVVDAFRDANFPMKKISRYDGEKIGNSMRGGYHIDLWEANVWLLECCGLCPGNIIVSGICTYKNYDHYYSARRETLNPIERIINGIKINPIL